ncbi:MAG: gfo/Idh/MocA family oxidoreductase [Proteobacteria bacterium]|nr:gfo/Idh/MocA family oxidoreductase [Pseudomonadota bacterium]
MPIHVAVLTHAAGPHLDAYLTGLAASTEVGSVSVADPSGSTFAVAQKVLGAKLKTTGKDMTAVLRETKPALALVTMEAVLAPPAIDAALEQGCHVMAEKPACVRAADFEPLVRKAEGKHLHLMLAFANRLRPEAREAQRLVREGRLGKLYGAEIHLVADQTRLKSESYRKNWFAQKARAGGGHFTWLGIHWLDLALFITGTEVEAVAGFSGTVGGQPMDVEDSNAAALRFSNGMFGTMTSGYYLDRGYHQHIKVWGEKGWLDLNHQPEVSLKWYSTAEPKVTGIQTYTPPNEPTGYTPWVHACARAAADLQDPPVTGREGLRVLDTIYAFYEAAKVGQTKSVARK